MLDLTRAMRNAGQIPTGVDRVGLAYLHAILDNPVPAYALIRSLWGYILLDEPGMTELLPLLSRTDAGAAAPEFRRHVWRTARKYAICRVVPPLLGWLLRRNVPKRAAYLNVSHANLTRRVLSTLKSSIQARVAVMIHDVIPLECPQFQRVGSVPRFAAMLERVNANADLLIYNSEVTQSQAKRYLGEVPSCIVAPLGTAPAKASPEELPAGLPPSDPYLVCIGTIEPRKNHLLLLDLWQKMGPGAPGLIIAGRRGWNNDAVWARLDALKSGGPVREVAGLSDGALAALVEQSCGVLFPSVAEGFGLPVTDAAARGVPVIVNDLPVYREILGDIPIYANVEDRYLWINKIKELAATGRAARSYGQYIPPSWAEHFKVVLSLT